MVSAWFLLIAVSFSEKHVRFREQHPFFRPKYGGCTIFSQKSCDGEQNVLMRSDLHNNAHNAIGVVFADSCQFFRKTCKI